MTADVLLALIADLYQRAATAEMALEQAHTRIAALDVELQSLRVEPSN